MFGLNRLRLNSQGGSLGFAIQRALFNVGEQGIWYDLNDDSTIFQDSAGTTLATWGDPVGRVLDKSKGLAQGANLFTGQTPTVVNSGGSAGSYDAGTRTMSNTGTGADSSYPRFTFALGMVVGVRYQVSGVLTGANLTVINAIRTGTSGFASQVAYNSTTGVFSAEITAETANLYFLTNATLGTWSITISSLEVYEPKIGNHAIQPTSGARPIRGRVPKRGRVNELVSTTTMATQNVTVTNAQRTLSFTGTGTVTLSGTSTAGPLVGTGVNDRVSLTFTPTAGTLTLTVTGSVTLAQLQLGAAFDNYQAVNDSLGFNVTESGQPSCGYLSFNGSNQWMQTAAAVNFSATDEMSVFAGVRKVSDAASGVVIELSTGTLNNGMFSLFAPSDSTFEFGFASRGAGTTAVSRIDNAAYAAPFFAAQTGLSDISTDTALLRLNGTQVATSATDQGTGNYGNYVTYFGARAGTSLFFNGLMFSTIIRGALTSGTLLTRTEQYVARQTPTVNL